MTEDNFEFDGNAVLVFDDDPKQLLPMSPPDENGNREMFVACCDCGLVHVFTLGPTGVVSVRRAPEEDAEKVRAATLAQDPSYFPLRARTLEGKIERVGDPRLAPCARGWPAPPLPQDDVSAALRALIHARNLSPTGGRRDVFEAAWGLAHRTLARVDPSHSVPLAYRLEGK